MCTYIYTYQILHISVKNKYSIKTFKYIKCLNECIIY